MERYHASVDMTQAIQSMLPTPISERPKDLPGNAPLSLTDEAMVLHPESNICPACGARAILSRRTVADHEYGLNYLAAYACCGNCKSLFQIPMPSVSELSCFYPESYHSMHGNNLLARLKSRLRIARIKSCIQADGAILDYGCGDGSFLRQAAQVMPQRQFFGFEISDHKEVVSFENNRVVLVKGTLADLIEILPPCAVITMNHVIEHLPDPHTVITSLHAKLVPGGIFEGQTPNTDSLEHKFFGASWSGYHSPRHTVIFSSCGLQLFLARAHFEQIEISPAFNPAGIAMSLASLQQGSNAGIVSRQGLLWLFWLAIATIFSPLDLLSGHAGIINFVASKNREEKAANDYIKRSDLISLSTVVAHIMLVLAPVYIAAISGPGIHWIFLWLWFGLSMNGLLNLMHECAHYHTFKSKCAGDFLGRYILGPLSFADFDGYRSRHWAHHRNLGVEGETKDAYLVSIYGADLLKLFSRCLLAVEAFKKLRHQTEIKAEINEPRPTAFRWLIGTAIGQAIFFASLCLMSAMLGNHKPLESLACAAGSYIAIYFYGLISVTVLAATLRAIAEHQMSDDGAMCAGYAALRNFSCNPLSRLIFGAYGFGEHATHHKEPGIPYYHLKKATLRLSSENPQFIPRQDYTEALIHMVKTKIHNFNIGTAL